MDYSFSECIGIWWHGKWQAVLLAIPLIKPEREGNKAPAWFRHWVPDWLWAYWLDDDRRPTTTWLYWYDYAAHNTFLSWFNALADRAINDSLYWVAGWTGKPKHGHYTLEGWLEAIRTRVGSWVPGWTTTLAVGLDALYWKLPVSIRGGYGSWSDLWDAIKDAVKDWARVRYDAFRVLAQAGWNWITGPGSRLSAFYDDTHTWITNFKENPAGVILGVLGGTWQRLITFDQGALSYFYNLWGSYRQTLADLIADPLGFLYDRAEQYLVNKW